MKKFIIIASLLLLFSLSGCNSVEGYSKLKAENQKLKREILLLKTQLNNYQNIKLLPIFYPEKDSVHLGESFKAVFYIGIYDETNPPIVTVYNSIKPDILDTLKYDKKIKGNIFSYHPSNKGHYTFFANMKIPFYSDTTFFKIKWTFNVY